MGCRRCVGDRPGAPGSRTTGPLAEHVQCRRGSVLPLPGAWGDPDGTERAELLEKLEQIRTGLEQIGTSLDEYRESLHKAPAIDWDLDDYGYDNDYTIDNDYGFGL